MKVFVTGGAGFVGLNIVSALCEKNHEVHAYVRNSSNLEYLSEFPVVLHRGDLLDSESVAASMKGMDAVIHCASMTGGFKKDRKQVFDTNVLGTRNVVDAALKNNIKRLVYTSSTSTIGVDKETRKGAEETPLRDFRKKGQYAQSKMSAEQIVKEAEREGLEVIILNPAEVMGAYDYHFGWGSVIVGLVHEQMPFIPPGGGTFCDASEVGRAHVAALTEGRSGEKYILGGADVKFLKLFEIISKIAACKLPDINVITNNYYMIKFVFSVKEALFSFTKQLPPLDSVRLRTFYSDMYFSSDKAIRELGYRAVPVENMIEKSYLWYRSQGMV